MNIRLLRIALLLAVAVLTSAPDAGETGDAIVSTSQGFDGFTSPRARFPFSRG